jgi:protein-tyrosine phosphatase
VRGLLEAYRLRHPERVRRVVFVCLGISAAAPMRNAWHALGMPAASIGLSTCTGAASPDAARAAASGEDLSAHRATDFRDFTVLPGDLFLAMEPARARTERRLRPQ